MKRIVLFLAALSLGVFLVGCSGVTNAADTSAGNTANTGGEFEEMKEIDLAGNTKIVVFGSDEASFEVTSDLVIRNNKALLVDTKFNKTDAREIINYLNESNVELTQIFISHSDPDYYFGLEEFKRAFPNVIARTTPGSAERISRTVLGKLVTWAEPLGDEVPKNPVIPEILAEKSFEFEGVTVEIFGADPNRTTLYIPELKVLLGGANITSGNHLFLADVASNEARANWLKNLEALKELNAEVVIPGHARLADETFDGSAIDFSIEYLRAVNEVLPTVDNSEAFIAAMEERYPNLDSRDVLLLSGPVLLGEMEWTE